MFLRLLLALLPAMAAAQYCPLEELIAPACICKELGEGPMMLCSNIMSPEELIPPVKATDGMDMFSISIQDSALMYLTSDLFKHTKFKKVMFSNSRILSLSDSDLAFEGLEEHLEEIRAYGATYIATWDWNQLRRLEKLVLLDIHNVLMHSLEVPFPALKTLRTLGLSNAELSLLDENAFRDLNNLDMLVLKNNRISELKRSMLPDPATKLYLLQLSSNQITTLPADFFTGMPSLGEVYLNHNKLVTLAETVFEQAMGQLRELNLSGNKFTCDCRMRWIVQVRQPSFFDGICEHPERLRGTKLGYLGQNDLWC